MHARRVALSTHDTPYHNLTTLPTEPPLVDIL